MRRSSFGPLPSVERFRAPAVPPPRRLPPLWSTKLGNCDPPGELWRCLLVPVRSGLEPSPPESKLFSVTAALPPLPGEACDCARSPFLSPRAL